MQTTQLIFNITKSPEGATGKKVIEIPKSGGSIGRDPSCAVNLLDGDRFISKSHCHIYLYGETYYISDVSRNGTFVNGMRIHKNQPISIHDGDFIALGRYEIQLRIELNTEVQNIAADIVPQKETNDPLSYLNDVISSNASERGNIDELFMETRGKEIDKNDPLAHLDFSLIEKEEDLINDDSLKNEKKTYQENVHGSRQIQDDSESIFSHYPPPTFITEDWMPSPLNPLSENSLSSSFSFEEANTSFDPSGVMQEPQNGLSENPEQYTEKDLYWEELNKLGHILGPHETPPSHNENNSSMHSKPKTSKNLGIAFFQGLGVLGPHDAYMTTDFFKNTGAALRICIEKLQRDLLDIEKLKASEEKIKSENILELMLSLNERNLLSPNELIEQILDELEEHKIHSQQAIKEAICAELKSLDPLLFAKQFSSQSLFITKRKLWRKYVDFFNYKSEKMNALNATSANKKIMIQYLKKQES